MLRYQISLVAAFSIASSLSFIAPAAAQDCRLIQRGYASWYGEEMAKGNRKGRPIFNETASGEPFYPSKVSAAHKTLPLGSQVKVVTNEGRALNVRINDRGPFVRGRILDLSRGAAEKLGIKGRGGGTVSLFRCP
jgi:rare lipoprotein A